MFFAAWVLREDVTKPLLSKYSVLNVFEPTKSSCHLQKSGGTWLFKGNVSMGELHC